jgi:hypothetical protein
VTCYKQPCKPCKVICILHYLPQGDESSPRGRWGICAPALPEVLTTSSHSMPNSHRRQQTPPRCAVTPPTPHVMVRRSAGRQHNLSQDMIAETISQANLCFSISTNQEPKNSTKLSSNNQVIILPEMANAVICPETGKSLTHQELITKLRYKIKWMRSTANEINRLYNTNTSRFIRR